MRILGIDPGYGITGFGLIESVRGNAALLQCGAITTPAGMDFSARLEIIYEDMRQLLQQAQPEAVAIEELFFGQNVTTGIGSSAYLRLLIFLPAILIPACVSSSPAFLMTYSAYKVISK